MVRYHAAQFKINPDKIGIMGFSAGGHLASAAETLFAKYKFGTDDISKVSSRPDFMCLVYPVISTKKGISHDCVKSLVNDLTHSNNLKKQKKVVKHLRNSQITGILNQAGSKKCDIRKISQNNRDFRISKSQRRGKPCARKWC